MDDAASQQARIPPAHVRVAEALRLEAPGAPELRRHGAEEEEVGALAEARGRRIVGGADARVMTADVLGVEVLVEHRAEQHAAELLHVRRGPMDELVRDDDAGVPRVDADEEDADERVGGPEAVHRDHPDEERDARDLERGEHVEHGVEGPARHASSPVAVARSGSACRATIEATMTSSQASAQYQRCGPVAKKRRHVAGRTKHRRWSAHTRAVASAAPVVEAPAVGVPVGTAAASWVFRVIGESSFTYESVCEAMVPTYQSVCQEGA